MDVQLERLKRQVVDRRRSVAMGIYALLVGLAYAVAFQFRFEFNVPAHYQALFLYTVLPFVIIRLAAFRALRLLRGRWRYVSAGDVARLGAGSGLGTLIGAGLDFLLPQIHVPVSIFAIELLLTCMLIAGVWLAYRLIYEQRIRHNSDRPTRRVLIVGAGEAGNLLAREMRRGGTGYNLIGFVDDDPSMHYGSLHGVDIMGGTDQLAELATKHRIDEVFLAIPSAEPAALRRIVEMCEGTRLPVKVLPGIKQVMAGDVSLNQLRDVRIEDLLGREPVDLHLPELAEDLSDCVVLITGAAGSIGSELARQVALHAPRALIILDQAETPLFFLDLELREAHPDLTIHPVICDIVDAAGIEQVFDRFQPHRVFHAAAYKHVPMMELNSRQAIRNNVIGTWRVADAAGRHGANRFVLVSTDKAVRPANVMGATKRLAEIVTLELQQEYPFTVYGAVRFGNVLGSAGSVIPVFKRQLEKGQQLTVTHPDVTRFFMTIPEAVQLVLQASLMNELRGHIAMLEMGEAVRIVELAHNLLRLAGYTGDLSERVQFSGLRPGEKLHEELVGPEEQSQPTANEKVRVIRSAEGVVQWLLPKISRIATSLEAGNESDLLGLTDRVLVAIPKDPRSAGKYAIKAS